MSIQTFTLEDIHRLQLEGIKEDNPEKLARAKHLLEVVCSQNPDDGIPLFYLANSYLNAGRYGVAIPLLHRARELLPPIHEAYTNLGTAYRGDHHVEKAREMLLKALEIKPTDPDTLNNLGTLHINEGTPEKGIEYLEKSIRHNPGHHQSHWNLGLCYLETERWREGFEKYAWGIATKDRMSKNYRNAIWWDGKHHPDATMVVYGEQGIGDEIMFASMIRDLQRRCGKLIFDCHPRLIEMFKRSFPGVDHYPTRKIFDRELEWTANYPDIDYKIAIGNAAQFLRHEESDFPRVPYLKASDEKVAEYATILERYLSGRPAIVLSWIGGVKKTRKDMRAIPLEAFKPLFEWARDAGVAIISGQYTEHQLEYGKFCNDNGFECLQFPDVFCSTISERYYPTSGGKRIPDGEGGDIMFRQKDACKAYLRNAQVRDGGYDFEHGKAYDFDETLSFIYSVYSRGGLVVSVNNSMVHLCGAAGIRCFTLTPCRPAWRYGLTRDDMVWYPPESVTQIRQRWIDREAGTSENWAGPIGRLIEKLEETYAHHNRVQRAESAAS